MAAPYILARTLKEAHAFAREELGADRGYYRIVNSASTLKSVRGADLYLVPGWDKRYDRFAVKGALRYTKMNVIDVETWRERQRAEEPATTGTIPVGPTREQVIADDLEPPGEQLIIPAEASVGDDVADFFGLLDRQDAKLRELKEVADDPEVTEAVDARIAHNETARQTAEEPAPKKRRRSRCKSCGSLHFKDESCPSEPLPGV